MELRHPVAQGIAEFLDALSVLEDERG